MAEKITDYFNISTTGESSRSSRSMPDGGDVDLVPSKAKQSKHRDTYDPRWAEQFPWLIHIPHDFSGQSDSGLLCALCKKHNGTSKRMVWINIPCKQLRKDKIRAHLSSQCHSESVKAESLAEAARQSGDIQRCFDEQVSLRRQAVKGAFKCMYWLAKEETAHFTKFGSLLQLGKFLGCSYLSELDIAKNATLHLQQND